jgi:hypothetical protein
MKTKTKLYLRIQDICHLKDINSAISSTLEMTILSSIALLTPMFLKHPQILVGVIINALLIKGAFSLKKYQTLPLIILPSVGVVLGGYLFGGLIKFVFYMIPAIWASNALLVYLFKTRTEKNYFTTLIFSAVAKTAFLFVIALAMYSLNLIPRALLIAMGYMQFITAVIGGGLVFIELNIEKWASQKKN